ncbi:EF-hand domain-containing protein [Streptomyces sp. NPDC052077]|uniref:EF-hand domain-containing protein n=1 Tax=Streptomyces sp. NPDC052077 TaxID=3154757 RepID=UPI003446C331
MTDAEAVFARIDTDGSGEIRLRELRDYGLADDGTLDGTRLAGFVRAADTDGDRRISLAEFKSHFARLTTPTPGVAGRCVHFAKDNSVRSARVCRPGWERVRRQCDHRGLWTPEDHAVAAGHGVGPADCRVAGRR